MVKTVDLESRRSRPENAPEASFPKCNPRFNFEGDISWRTEEMHVVGHDHIGADHPAIGFPPRCQEGLVDSGICEILSSLPRTHSDKNDRRLTKKNEDAFCRMATLL
jgi:hypothetical protein